MNAKDFWNKLADNYDVNVNKTYADAYQKTIDLSKEYVKRDDRLLAYACGTGIVSNTLAAHVQSIKGIDISEKMIANAQQKAERENISNVSYAVAALEDESIQAGGYDVITAFNVLYFLSDLDAKLELIYKMLPENGYFLSVTDCVGIRKGLKHFVMGILMRLNLMPYIRYMTTDELTTHIEKAGFKIVHVENLHPEPPNLYVVAQK
ncbi:MAG: methyltransferase domain-containing protein [Anaerolineaceae bacterium]|nr:methyltransferase domain-containing protein [Anaerolineaceae bacterium]